MSSRTNDEHLENGSHHGLRPRKRARLERGISHDEDSENDEEEGGGEEEALPAPPPVRQARPARVTRRRQQPVATMVPIEVHHTETAAAGDLNQDGTTQLPAPRARPVRNARRRETTAASPDTAAVTVPVSIVVPDASMATGTAPPVRKPRRKAVESVGSVEDESTAEDENVEQEHGMAEEVEDGDDVIGYEQEDNDDPEEHEIDTKTVSMYDLSHDGQYGKTSERERKMAQIDWAAVKKKRQEEAEAIMYGRLGKDKLGESIIPSTENRDHASQVTQNEPITRGVAGGVGYRLVNGEIVEDVDSLTIDRAARVADAAAAADEAVEEENDLTVRINRTTYINARKRDETERVPFGRGKSDAWSNEDTDKFYDALTMFGTDFFIISKMFPPRTRKQIKLKFIREERLEPDRINAALLGKKTGKIDLDHYAQAIDRDVDDFHKYDSLEHANQVIRESMKDREDAMRAAVKEDEENNRQREVQRQQREKHRVETERKKEERARKKAARRGGNVWGTGTMGGADDDAAAGE